jgi:hypothetical protein
VRSPVRENLNALMMLQPNTGAATIPGDPAALRATVNGTQIDLQWTDNAFNEGGFEIERGLNGVYTSIGTVPRDTTHYSDKTAPRTANISYRVRSYNPQGKSRPSTVWVYSGWTELNFITPSNLPLYTYYQSSNLRWSRGGDYRPDHVALNNDSQHGAAVTVDVDVAALGAEGTFYVYFLYQDASNWYRLRADRTASAFERNIAGTIAQVGAAGAGVSIGNGTDLQRWQVRSTVAGALSFTVNEAAVVSASEPLKITSGMVGLGAKSQTPVWESFRFQTP